MSLMLDAAELATRAALSAGLSLFIDILRKNPHLPVLEELAVMPIGADRLSSMGEEIRLVLLLEAILASREDEAVGMGRFSESARAERNGGVGVAVSSSLYMLSNSPADRILLVSG